MNDLQPEIENSQGAGGTTGGRLHLLGVDADELRGWLKSAGQQPYRAAQVLEWIYRKNATSFDAMTNLSKPLRAWLDSHATIYRTQVTAVTAAGDGTTKLLLTCEDGAAVETVWIPAEDRHTACISSQVGCAVGCRFCASGLDGVERNLAAGEIVEQAMRIRQFIARGDSDATAGEGESDPSDAGAGAAAGELRPPRLSNIVMMGMGEPLANYREVIKAIRIMNAPWGLGIGARKITVSTVGLPAQIRRLAGEDLQLNLALSLHAVEDDLRRELIPWGKGVPIRELLDACADYFDKTGREITFEYVLLEGVNDRPKHADRLAVFAKKLRANVNLLRYNPVPGLPYRRPSAEAAFAFQERLRRGGVNAHVRTSRGKDVNAACGQLRRARLTAGGGEVVPEPPQDPVAE